MKAIAVIPARGGSKRIPRKNIRPFAGKPMIAWSISAAFASRLFDHVIVSTDDAEIAEVARQAGAEVPFVRPPGLAGDHAGTTPVIAHAISWARDAGWDFDAACCIYATAPTLRPEDLQSGLSILMESGASFAFSATDYAASIFRAFEQTEDGRLRMFWPEQFETRSQDLPRALHDAAQFYWGLPQAWLEGNPLFGQDSVPVIIPRYRVQDIDTDDDWHRAEALVQALRNA